MKTSRSEVMAARNVTAKQAAQISGINYGTILRLIHTGQLRCTKVGRAIRVPLSALREMGLDVPDAIPAASTEEVR